MRVAYYESRGHACRSWVRGALCVQNRRRPDFYTLLFPAGSVQFFTTKLRPPVQYSCVQSKSYDF
jgi:hypothetical protein